MITALACVALRRGTPVCSAAKHLRTLGPVAIEIIKQVYIK